MRKGSSGADTLPNVVRKGAERRPGNRERSALVNNLAAGQDRPGSGKFAPLLHGRGAPAPARARPEITGGGGCVRANSERTAPREGSPVSGRGRPRRAATRLPHPKDRTGETGPTERILPPLTGPETITACP